ncbi:SMI1/KNR4 family protein [Pleionea sp. CnH1-48]|uniref:SMI1/KNR4 family protein n=1 Tax=Pleionea sp. CnH1-48 TaxID=2954494 RepID=UPI002096BA8D|nr:SMI1/KNR4 family protein [Pleionea sp. CnH1-48]MCO7223558.1 SMI1/KNR4 family protein [Pleionea sp. CnH1-48]
MKEKDLVKVESELKIKIPSLYRQFLADLPSELTNDDESGIYCDADTIIKATMSARDYKEEDWDEPFANNLLAVGWNGGGSCYCIREGESGEQVYLFDHELGAIDPKETLNLKVFIKEWLLAD